MPTFNAFTPRVDRLVKSIQRGEALDNNEQDVQQVRQALRLYDATLESNVVALHGITAEQIRDMLREYHRPGPKSALFARLLSSKEPLPYPPPTSFSYPWYALIEKPGPHPVSSVGGAATLQSIINGDMGGGCKRHILLDQCVWDIVSANGPAEELLSIAAQFSEQEHEIEPALAPYWQRILDAYRAGPEMIVRYGRWPDYRLRVGRTVAIARRDHAEKSVEAAGRMDSMYGPLDLSALDLNAVVGKAVSHFNVVEHIENRRKSAKPGEGAERNLMRYLEEQESQGDDEAIGEYLANPSAYDFVNFETDAWVLEKVVTENAAGEIPDD